jgi:hypothetical protein
MARRAVAACHGRDSRSSAKPSSCLQRGGVAGSISASPTNDFKNVLVVHASRRGLRRAACFCRSGARSAGPRPVSPPIRRRRAHTLFAPAPIKTGPDADAPCDAAKSFAGRRSRKCADTCILSRSHMKGPACRNRSHVEEHDISHGSGSLASALPSTGSYRSHSISST